MFGLARRAAGSDGPPGAPVCTSAPPVSPSLASVFPIQAASPSTLQRVLMEEKQRTLSETIFKDGRSQTSQITQRRRLRCINVTNGQVEGLEEPSQRRRGSHRAPAAETSSRSHSSETFSTFRTAGPSETFLMLKQKLTNILRSLRILLILRL